MYHIHVSFNRPQNYRAYPQNPVNRQQVKGKMLENQILSQKLG